MALVKVQFRTPTRDNERLIIPDAEQVAAYLGKGAVLFEHSTAKLPDPLFGGEKLVPIGNATDGVFVWPLAVEYFVRVHRHAPDERLLDAIRARDYKPRRITKTMLEQIRQEQHHPQPPAASSVFSSIAHVA